MKGTRLADVLDDKKIFQKEKWDVIIGKLKKLGTAIEMYHGPSMNIDNADYRWVQDRIEYYEKDGRLLTEQEMKLANTLWKQFGKKA
mgnify:CR=1 FL=1|jgi:hypothetical protein|tara:strand:+ start:66 stop:326 length:261 start_codon:yes stop_codon:yes gene_type:complete